MIDHHHHHHHNITFFLSRWYLFPFLHTWVDNNGILVIHVLVAHVSKYRTKRDDTLHYDEDDAEISNKVGDGDLTKIPKLW